MKKIKLSEVWDQLPPPCQAWIERKLPSDRQRVEDILNEHGLEGFIEHWQEYRQQEIQKQDQKMKEVYNGLATDMYLGEELLENEGVYSPRARPGPYRR